MRNLTLLLLCACGAEPSIVPPSSDGHGGLIIGGNDLLAVNASGSNVPARYRELLDAFGLISVGCTATHVGGGLALSAGHCFGATSRRRALPCEDVSVYWGYRGAAEPYLESACTEVIAAETDDDRDYALFRVSPAPTASVEVELASRPGRGKSLTMFGHPDARPLEWSRRCVLESGPAHGFGADHFAHQCDSQPGSSGSSILADVALRIVGIHDGGGGGWNYATYVADTPLAELLSGTDLGGWKLVQENAAAALVLPPGTRVAPGGTLVVARDATRGEFETFWGIELPPSVTFINSAGGFPRLNGGEQVALLDPTGRAVGDEAPAVEPGRSYRFEAGAWREGPAASATPGVAARGGPMLSEVSDAPGTGNWKFELVEVVVP